MSRQWYQSLTIQELRCLARKEGVRQVEAYSTEDLIDLLEEIQEDKLSDRSQNNDIMRLKGKKYDIFRENPIDAEDPAFEIPQQYANTSIHLLLRDPFWAFSYWDINRLDLQKMKDKHESLELYLRVFELEKATDEFENALSSFEIPIQDSDSSWYINLPNPGRWYVVQLLCDCNDGKNDAVPMAMSNIVESPGGYWLSHIERLRTEPKEFELFLSGLADHTGKIADNALVEMVISQVASDPKELQRG